MRLGLTLAAGGDMVDALLVIAGVFAAVFVLSFLVMVFLVYVWPRHW